MIMNNLVKCACTVLKLKYRYEWKKKEKKKVILGLISKTNCCNRPAKGLPLRVNIGVYQFKGVLNCDLKCNFEFFHER